jgi:hypothetical protein
VSGELLSGERSGETRERERLVVGVYPRELEVAPRGGAEVLRLNVRGGAHAHRHRELKAALRAHEP